ncbi:MAG: hypothetical protein JWM82_3935, partial [Myxococcales bacterium]|nr:hypothetical protein [Myxococcales bacterium]
MREMPRARSSTKVPAAVHVAAVDFGDLPTEGVHPDAAHLDEMSAEKVVALMVGEEA